MASSFPCGEIRQLLVHVYPDGSKAGAAERVTVFYGRRGRPVKKPRFMPAALAHQWARNLQARRVGTVSVLSGASWSASPAAGSPVAGPSLCRRGEQGRRSY
ncbi:MAG: hypothetical protein NTW51_07515 [Cyanobacteria bacterium]|nr:hypothetical protein [Cyanobacteriota bacterium]